MRAILGEEEMISGAHGSSRRGALNNHYEQDVWG